MSNESETARQNISTNPQDSLQAYTRLRNLTNELSSRNEKAWGSMIHLIEHAEAITKQSWDEMEQCLSV